MRVACLLAGGFEDSEFRVPHDAFEAAGHEVVIVGLEAGQRVDGYKGSERGIEIERAAQETGAGEFDALFIPGGQSPDRLRAHAAPLELVRGFFSAGKPVLTICHGPQLFLSAGTFRNHRMTAWKTVQGDLALAGAEVVDEEVVVDGNLVTSRQPSDLPAFVRESLRILGPPATA